MDRTVELRCKNCGFRIGAIYLEAGRAVFRYRARNQPLIAFNQHHRKTPVDDHPVMGEETEPAELYIDQADGQVVTWHKRCHAKSISVAMLRSFHADATRRGVVKKYTIS